jgi:hypothetical protein
MINEGVIEVSLIKKVFGAGSAGFGGLLLVGAAAAFMTGEDFSHVPLVCDNPKMIQWVKSAVLKSPLYGDVRILDVQDISKSPSLTSPYPQFNQSIEDMIVQKLNEENKKIKLSCYGTALTSIGSSSITWNVQEMSDGSSYISIRIK